MQPNLQTLRETAVSMVTRESHLVSVIIPCFNQARFLGEAIESVLRQSYPRYEVIVVDDGSSDNTAEVAACYEGVRCFRQQNRGLAAARNSGLRLSKGDYLVFLDSDDRLLPDALQVGVNCLSAHPDCAFVYGHVRLIADDGSPLPSPTQTSVEKEHYLELLRHNYIWTPGAVMYRRRVFDSVPGFNTSVNASADFDLNIRVARDFPVRCHSKVVIEYRKHGVNMSRDFATMLKSSVSVRRAQRRYIRGNRQHREALDSGIRAVQDDYGEKLATQVGIQMRTGEWKQAMAGMVTLLRYHPKGVVRRVIGKIVG